MKEQQREIKSNRVSKFIVSAMSAERLKKSPLSFHSTAGARGKHLRAPALISNLKKGLIWTQSAVLRPETNKSSTDFCWILLNIKITNRVNIRAFL